MKTKIKVLIILIIILLGIALSFIGKEIKYGIQPNSRIVIAITEENSSRIAPINIITQKLFEEARESPATFTELDSKKLNQKQTSFLYHSYDIVFIGLVSNRDGETRITKKIEAKYTNVIGFSWNIALLYIFIFAFIVMLLMQLGVPIYFSWAFSLVIAISIVDTYLIDNTIFAVWIFILYVFSIIFAIAARYENKRKYEILYLVLSAIFVLVPTVILLYMVYKPII